MKNPTLHFSILGIKIIDEDYQERVIKIAFNPMAKEDEERFAVQDQSHIKSSKWIEDISNGKDNSKSEREKSLNKIYKFKDDKATERVVNYLIEKANL